MKKIQEYSLLLFIEIALVAMGSIVSILYPDATIWTLFIILILSLLVIYFLLQFKNIKTRNNKIMQKLYSHIDWTIKEKNIQHFEQEIRNLYPHLIKRELKTPLIDPIRIGHPVYDKTWHEFHLTFLKVLRRQIRNNKFDSNQWNTDVDKENAKRRHFVERYTTPK